jgi:hypothetical protein
MSPQRHAQCSNATGSWQVTSRGVANVRFVGEGACLLGNGLSDHGLFAAAGAAPNYPGAVYSLSKQWPGAVGRRTRTATIEYVVVTSVGVHRA